MRKWFKEWWENLPNKDILCILAIACTLIGGTKGFLPKILYPTTEAGISYLIDKGSYITNDYAIINFDRRIVPNSAKLYIDKLFMGESTNKYENVLTTTFGEFSLPHAVYIENITNYHIFVYTDWTPGPAVQTNGVWEIVYMYDKNNGERIIPLNTMIYNNGFRILPNPIIFTDEEVKKILDADVTKESKEVEE
jgi:hypothetical protein